MHASPTVTRSARHRLLPTSSRIVGRATLFAWLVAAFVTVAQGEPVTVPAESTISYYEILDLSDSAQIVAVAVQALERAERQAEIAGVPVDVGLSLGYDATWGSREPGAGAEPVDLADGNVSPIGLTVRVEQFLLGPSADARARALDAVDAALGELQAARRRARIDVVTAFQDSIRAAEAAELARDEASLAQREAAAVEQRRAAGAASELAVAEAALRLATAQQSVDASEREAALARRSLDTLFGRELPVPVGPLPEVPDLPDPAALSPENVRDVRSARRDVGDADRTADSAIRDVFPNIAIDARYQAGDADRSFSLGASLDSARLAPSLDFRYDPDDGVPGLVADDSTLSSFAIGVRLDVVLDPALGDALEVVRIGRQAARDRLSDATARAELALERAWAAAADSAERVELARRRHELAVQAAEVERLRSDSGAASEATVLRAELDARRAALDLASARHAYRLSVFRLLDAAGAPPESLE